MILDRIVAKKIIEVAEHKERLPLEILMQEYKSSERDFKDALCSGNPSLIAEIKHSSPSENVINESFDFDHIANIYNANYFVKAVSILTDEPFFKGKLEYLQKSRKMISKPLLRKDFIIDEYQIYESRYYGADAILLIARILSKDQMEKYIEIARSLNMDCLVEIHAEKEIQKLPENVEIIGINNRNLDTMEIDINSTAKLIQKLDNNKILVSESGLHSYQDVWTVKNNINAMLIGTSLIRANNIDKKINSLFRPRIKICGITNITDAEVVISAGTDYIGFIFYEKSKRYIQPAECSVISNLMKKKYPNIKLVGVFVNESSENVNIIANMCKLDFVQFHGEETENDIKEIGASTIKAFRIKDNDDLKQYFQFPSDFVLLDSFDVSEYGGTGKTFNWDNLMSQDLSRTFIAGGINSENIEDAVKLQSFALDISSGVEKSPGIKDDKKIKLLFDTINNNE